MKNQMNLVTFGILLALMAAPISAQPGWGGWWFASTNPLGLTTEQMKEIQQVTIQWQEEMAPLWSTLQVKNLELQRLIWQSNSDPAELEAKSREVGELQAKVQKGMLERRAAIRGLLTEEQQALYDIQGMGWGLGRGPCGLGLGRGPAGAFGWGRGRGWGGPPSYGFGVRGSGWGRGPCGMGMGRGRWLPPGW